MEIEEHCTVAPRGIKEYNVQCNSIALGISWNMIVKYFNTRQKYLNTLS